MLEADSPLDVWFQTLGDLNEIRLQVAPLSWQPALVFHSIYTVIFKNIYINTIKA